MAPTAKRSESESVRNSRRWVGLEGRDVLRPGDAGLFFFSTRPQGWTASQAAGGPGGRAVCVLSVGSSDLHASCGPEATSVLPRLADTMDYSPAGSSVHGILQARVLEWVAISFSRGSS